VPVLDCDHTSRGEAAPVADPFDLVDDRNTGIAGAHEIAVQRVRSAVFHGSGCGDERLADHLAAEYALPSDLRAAATKQVVFQRFKVENGQKAIEGVAHAALLLGLISVSPESDRHANSAKPRQSRSTASNAWNRKQ